MEKQLCLASADFAYYEAKTHHPAALMLRAAALSASVNTRTASFDMAIMSEAEKKQRQTKRSLVIRKPSGKPRDSRREMTSANPDRWPRKGIYTYGPSRHGTTARGKSTGTLHLQVATPSVQMQLLVIRPRTTRMQITPATSAMPRCGRMVEYIRCGCLLLLRPTGYVYANK